MEDSISLALPPTPPPPTTTTTQTRKTRTKSKPSEQVLNEYERAFSKIFSKEDDDLEGTTSCIQLASSSSSSLNEEAFYVTLIKFGPEIDEFLYSHNDVNKNGLSNNSSDCAAPSRHSIGILTRRYLPANEIPPFIVFLNGIDPCHVNLEGWVKYSNSSTVMFTNEEMKKILYFQQYFWSFHHSTQVANSTSSQDEAPLDPRHFLVIPFLGELTNTSMQRTSNKNSNSDGDNWANLSASSRPFKWVIDWKLLHNVAISKKLSGWEWVVSLGKLLDFGSTVNDQNMNNTIKAHDKMNNTLVKDPVAKVPPFDDLFDQAYEVRDGFVDSLDATNFTEIVMARVNSVLAQTVIVTPHNQQPYECISLSQSTHPTSAFLHKRTPINTQVDVSATYESYVKNLGYQVPHPSSAMIEVKPIPAIRNMAHQTLKFKKQAKSKRKNKDTVSTLLVPDVGIVGPMPMAMVRLGMVLPSVIYKLDLYCLIYEFRERMTIPNVTISTLYTAFSAPVAHEPTNYDRLELLGDAFLKFASSMDLYLSYPNATEGILSHKRESIVSNHQLFQRAVNHGLTGLLIVDKFNPRNWAAPGFTAQFKAALEDTGNPDESSNTNILPDKNWKYRSISQKMLADCLEAIVGACAWDGGVEAGLKILCQFGMISPEIWRLAASTKKTKSSIMLNESGSNSNSQNEEWFKEVEKKINYRFRNRDVLKLAFTHHTYRQGLCYERLEFLGDALMDWIITQYFYNAHPNLDAGNLSDLRGASLNNDCFSFLSVGLNFHKYLLHKSPSLQTNIDVYLKYWNTLIHKDGFVGSGMSITVASMSNGEGRGVSAPKALGDVFEAVAAAILIDSNWDVAEVWRILQPLLTQYIEKHANPNIVNKSSVRQIHEYFQGAGFGVNDISYRYDFNAVVKEYTCHILLRGDQLVSGNGNSRVAAKKAAATNCLTYIESHRQELIERLAVRSSSTSNAHDPSNVANTGANNSSNKLVAQKTKMSSLKNDRLDDKTLSNNPLCHNSPRPAPYTNDTTSELPMPISSSQTLPDPTRQPHSKQPLSPSPHIQPSNNISATAMQFEASQLQELGRLFVQLVHNNAITISPNALLDMGSSLSLLLLCSDSNQSPSNNRPNNVSSLDDHRIAPTLTVELGPHNNLMTDLPPPRPCSLESQLQPVSSLTVLSSSSGRCHSSLSSEAEALKYHHHRQCSITDVRSESIPKRRKSSRLDLDDENDIGRRHKRNKVQ